MLFAVKEGVIQTPNRAVDKYCNNKVNKNSKLRKKLTPKPDYVVPSFILYNFVFVGHKITLLLSSMMLALTGVKSYFAVSFPLLQVKPFILPSVSLVAEKNVQDYVVTFGAIGL